MKLKECILGYKFPMLSFVVSFIVSLFLSLICSKQNEKHLKDMKSHTESIRWIREDVSQPPGAD